MKKDCEKKREESLGTECGDSLRAAASGGFLPAHSGAARKSTFLSVEINVNTSANKASGVRTLSNCHAPHTAAAAAPSTLP